MQSPFFLYPLFKQKQRKRESGKNSSDGFDATEIMRTICAAVFGAACVILQLSFLSKGLDKLLQLYILYIYS